MFGPLIHALARRGLDSTFLPSSVPLSSRTQAFNDIAEHVIRLTNVISGNTLDQKLPKLLPPLPILLRDRIVSSLADMEIEAVELGKSIELNRFRSARGDPRARSEEELAAWRSEAYTRWKMLTTELEAEVKAVGVAERRKAGSRL